MSPPNCFHPSASFVSLSYTRTCPDTLPLASLPTAPIATIDPSLDNDSDHPEVS